MPKIIKQCYRDKTGQRSRHLSRFFMVTLLAESKTMAAHQSSVSEEDYLENMPAMEEMADSLMLHIDSLSISSIAEILGISNQLAVKAHSFAYDFPHKLAGYKALYAFTGEAFRALDVSSFSHDTLEYAKDNLRLVSSVYGLLKPDDIIKPYRCEFNKPIFPDMKTPIQVFKQKNTIEIVNLIKNDKITDVIDLLPGDADKSFDWKIIRAFSRVHKVCFQTITPDGKLKTPIASRLKELRGKMARLILTQGIGSFNDLCSFSSQDFIYSHADSKPGLPVFISS